MNLVRIQFPVAICNTLLVQCSICMWYVHFLSKHNDVTSFILCVLSHNPSGIDRLLGPSQLVSWNHLGGLPRMAETGKQPINGWLLAFSESHGTQGEPANA
jgi:hypothetical protein